MKSAIQIIFYNLLGYRKKIVNIFTVLLNEMKSIVNLIHFVFYQ